MEVLRQSFRPEFLNRIDEVLIFNRLGREEISKIVEIQLGLVRDRMAHRASHWSGLPKPGSRWPNPAMTRCTGQGPQACDSKRTRESLAMEILQGGFVPGDRITVDAAEDGETNGTLAFHSA